MVDRLELERRVMIAALASTCLAAVLWLTAICTMEWARVTFDEWRFINSTNNRTNVKSYYMGLWEICADLYFNATDTKKAIGPSTYNSYVLAWSSRFAGSTALVFFSYFR